MLGTRASPCAVAGTMCALSQLSLRLASKATLILEFGTPEDFFPISTISKEFLGRSPTSSSVAYMFVASYLKGLDVAGQLYVASLTQSLTTKVSP